MKKYLLFSLLSFYALAVSSQHKCATHQHLTHSCEKDPSRLERLQAMEELASRYKLEKKNRGDADITIPVVVHVLWNTPEQNISDEQIFSQIDVLNEDFRLENFDAPDIDHPFWLESSDTYIEFCLAQQDEDGVATTGINRVWTPVNGWTETNIAGIKQTSLGGQDNWDPQFYLNIWVASFDASFSLLGYATFPDDLETNPNEDGVVVRANAFGDMGTATFPNDEGRTATHEVGHWLSLRHIWGDDYCGNDFVDDTPVHFYSNYGCPDFPLNPFSECGTDEYGEMYMNYMDYVDDYCMNMFTFGQAERMWSAIENYRYGLLVSEGCQPGFPVSIEENQSMSFKTRLFPNPTSGELTVSFNSDQFAMIEFRNVLGDIVYKNTVYSGSVIDTSELSAGTYIASILCDGKVEVTKIIVQ